MRAIRTAAGLLAAAALFAGASGCGGNGSGASPQSDPSPSTAQPTGLLTTDGILVPTELASILATATAGTPTPTGSAGKDTRVLGADFSWPQCPKGMGIPQKRTEGQPMPTDAARFVIIGLTNGPSFVANPCLESQVKWARDRKLLVAAYSITTYPDARTLAELGDKGPFDGGSRLGALRNVGYQAALFNVATMSQAGLKTPAVWIDVEPVAHFEWSDDLVANAAVVEGVARGYKDSGFRTGFYSTPVLWKRVVGDLRLGAPEWRAAGKTSMEEALRRCREDWSFQGGEAIFGQWVEANRDRNVTCPGAATDLSRWFHQY